MVISEAYIFPFKHKINAKKYIVYNERLCYVISSLPYSIVGSTLWAHRIEMLHEPFLFWSALSVSRLVVGSITTLF